jgi:hypothetical protein
MNVETFKTAFDKAAQDALLLGRKHAKNPIPDHLLFNVDPYDDPNGERAPEGMIKSRSGDFLFEKDLNGVDAAAAMKLLLVNEKLPEWIHMGVVAANQDSTYIRISYCTSSFTDNDLFLRYRNMGNPPFRVWLPNLPGFPKPGQKIELPRPEQLKES